MFNGVKLAAAAAVDRFLDWYFLVLVLVFLLVGTRGPVVPVYPISFAVTTVLGTVTLVVLLVVRILLVSIGYS